MSEYQYYHFLAIDRPLSREEMAELRALSTRATITATSFSNEYQWGNFKGNPDRLMERYFDAFVYITNWGTRQLQLRFPRRLLPPDVVAPYCVSNRLELRVAGEYTVLTFLADDESGYWELDRDPAEWLPALVPLREELMNGDLRALYLAWLAAVEGGAVDDEAPEPPLPPGLVTLPASLDALAELLMLDRDLIGAAAVGSELVPASSGSPREVLVAWIAALPEQEKTALLVRLAADRDGTVGAELRQRHREASGASTRLPASRESRKAGALLAAAARLAEERARQAAERKARARAQYLRDLVGREAAAWREVEGVFNSPLKSHAKASAFEQKAKLLQDLRELAQQEDRLDAFEERVAALRAQHAKKTSFWARYDGTRRW